MPGEVLSVYELRVASLFFLLFLPSPERTSGPILMECNPKNLIFLFYLRIEEKKYLFRPLFGVYAPYFKLADAI